MARGVLLVGLGEKIYVPFPILSLCCQRDRATGAPIDLCPRVPFSSACHGGAGGIKGLCHLLSLAPLAAFCPLCPPQDIPGVPSLSPSSPCSQRGRGRCRPWCKRLASALLVSGAPQSSSGEELKNNNNKMYLHKPQERGAGASPALTRGDHR